MRHRFIYDTRDLSPWTQRKLKQYHFRRRERLHRTLCPFLVVALVVAIKWAAGVFGI